MNQTPQHQTRSQTYTMKLCNLPRKDTELVGAKAANLGELMQAGLPVPDGFVLTNRRL